MRSTAATKQASFNDYERATTEHKKRNDTVTRTFHNNFIFCYQWIMNIEKVSQSGQ